MAIVSFDKDTVVEYMPEYGDNRDDKKPCIIGIKFAGYGRINEYGKEIRIQTTAKIKGAKPEDISDIRTEVTRSVQKKQFMDSVDSIKNFFLIGTDGKQKECTDVKEFYSKAPSELIYEILSATEDNAKLTDGQRKN